jgi:hypothetical protein
MWKKLGAALLGAVLLGAAAGCTPTSTPSTSSSTSTTSISSSGPREAYLPITEALQSVLVGAVGAEVFAPSPDLAIDSANYPAGTALTARVAISGDLFSGFPAGSYSGPPVGSEYGVCVSLQTLESALPVGDEVCVVGFVAAVPLTGRIVIMPTPVFDAGAGDSFRITVTGMLRPGENKYVLRIRPADGFTCSSGCKLGATPRSLRASW